MDPAEFWATGDYAVVGDLWAQPGRDLAASLPVRGRDVVDLATGIGVTAIAAAQHGARSVTGVDVTAGLLREAERRAAAAGVAVRWLEADVASVPLPSRCADLVTSTFGLVFAADPQLALAEAARLLRPKGEVIFTSWSGTGFFGHVRQTLAPFFPEAPEPWHETAEGIGAVVPQARVTERSFVMAVPSPEGFIELLERHSAPIVLGSQSLGDRWAEARQRLVELAREAAVPRDGAFEIPVSYLVTSVPGAAPGEPER